MPIFKITNLFPTLNVWKRKIRIITDSTKLTKYLKIRTTRIIDQILCEILVRRTKKMKMLIRMRRTRIKTRECAL